MPTAKADRSFKDDHEIDMFLYSIPSNAIKKVPLGTRASEGLLAQVRSLKSENEKFNHLLIEKMYLDEKAFKLIAKSA